MMESTVVNLWAQMTESEMPSPREDRSPGDPSQAAGCTTVPEPAPPEAEEAPPQVPADADPASPETLEGELAGDGTGPAEGPEAGTLTDPMQESFTGANISTNGGPAQPAGGLTSPDNGTLRIALTPLAYSSRNSAESAASTARQGGDDTIVRVHCPFCKIERLLSEVSLGHCEQCGDNVGWAFGPAPNGPSDRDLLRSWVRQNAALMQGAEPTGATADGNQGIAEPLGGIGMEVPANGSAASIAGSAGNGLPNGTEIAVPDSEAPESVRGSVSSFAMVDIAELLSTTSNVNNTEDDVSEPQPVTRHLGGPILSMADNYKAAIILHGDDMSYLQDVATCIRNEQRLTETERTELIMLAMEYMRRGPRRM